MKFLTNLGNSQAAIVDEIRSEEKVHWLLGLRKAELIILDKQRALQNAEKCAKKAQRQDNYTRLQVEAYLRLLPFIRWIPLLAVSLSNKIEDLRDELVERELHAPAIEAQVRDAVMECWTASEEHSRIVAAHPDAMEMGYAELQEQLSAIALEQKKARFVASRIWAATNGLPESVGALLFDCEPDQRDRILAYSRRMQHEMQSNQPQVVGLSAEEKQELLEAFADEDLKAQLKAAKVIGLKPNTNQ